MHWPQITMIALMSVSCAITAIKHGEPREPHSIWPQLISTAIIVGLLYAGGFWETKP